MADTSTQSGVPRLDSPFVQPNLQVSIPWYRFLITLWNRTGGSGGGGGSGSAVPTGSIVMQAFNQVTSDYLLCNGAEVSRDVFLTLFQTIGTTWGAGDGINTFNVPNLIGRTLFGGATAGALGGVENISLSVANLAPHSHDVIDPGHVHGVTDPGHSHTQQVVSNNTAGTSGSQGASAANTTSVGTTVSATTGLTVNSATTGLTIDTTGGGEPFSILPPYATLVPVIKI